MLQLKLKKIKKKLVAGKLKINFPCNVYHWISVKDVAVNRLLQLSYQCATWDDMYRFTFLSTWFIINYHMNDALICTQSIINHVGTSYIMTLNILILEILLRTAIWNKSCHCWLYCYCDLECWPWPSDMQGMEDVKNHSSSLVKILENKLTTSASMNWVKKPCCTWQSCLIMGRETLY